MMFYNLKIIIRSRSFVIRFETEPRNLKILKEFKNIQ